MNRNQPFSRIGKLFTTNTVVVVYTYARAGRMET